MTTPKQQANGLIDRYIFLYKEKYGKAPSINRYRETWGFVDMIKDLGYGRAKEVIEYYFETNKVGHTLIYLFKNYDRYDTLMRERAEDEVKRAQLREQTRLRVEEMERNGN